jgi:hypothetical protein
MSIFRPQIPPNPLCKKGRWAITVGEREDTPSPARGRGLTRSLPAQPRRRQPIFRVACPIPRQNPPPRWGEGVQLR